MVQCLRLLTPNAGDLGLIPGPRTRSHMPQLGLACCRRSHMSHRRLKILCATLRPGTAKEINVYFKNESEGKREQVL